MYYLFSAKSKLSSSSPKTRSNYSNYLCLNTLYFLFLSCFDYLNTLYRRYLLSESSHSVNELRSFPQEAIFLYGSN
jgi:hypothetical protein